MSTDHNTPPLFPEEWGWQKYEDTFREYVERIAQANELHLERCFAQLDDRPDYSSYEGVKIRRWTALQMLVDRLPGYEQMAALSDRQRSDFDVLFRKLVAEARLRQRAALRWEKPPMDRNPPLPSLTPANRNKVGARRPTKRSRQQDKDFDRGI